MQHLHSAIIMPRDFEITILQPPPFSLLNIQRDVSPVIGALLIIHQPPCCFNRSCDKSVEKLKKKKKGNRMQERTDGRKFGKTRSVRQFSRNGKGEADSLEERIRVYESWKRRWIPFDSPEFGWLVAILRRVLSSFPREEPSPLLYSPLPFSVFSQRLPLPSFLLVYRSILLG